MNEKNPFLQYYRQIKMYLTLPSGTNYYTSNVIDFTDEGSVGIKPMSGDDQIILTNPDALLNGEAIRSVLLSCVDGLKKPEMLMNNDVDALMIAIRHVTYGDHNEYTPVCPECAVENKFKFNVGGLLEDISPLDQEYWVTLSNGLVVFIKPYMFKDRIATYRLAFEQEKLKKTITAGDEDKTIQVLSQCIKKMSELNRGIINNAILKIVLPDGSTIVNHDASRKDFDSLLRNLGAADYTLVDDRLKEINEIGVKGSVPCVCTSCGHSWEAKVDLNPINFSLAF